MSSASDAEHSRMLCVYMHGSVTGKNHSNKLAS